VFAVTVSLRDKSLSGGPSIIKPPGPMLGPKQRDQAALNF